MCTVLTVGKGQLSGGVHPVTLKEIVPVGPGPQTTVTESLVGEGAGKKVPFVTVQL
jgi:hypothetical protein